MYKLVFFVPESHVEQVKDAVFEAGGGRYKAYDRCSWQVRGTGQFRPLEGSNPFLGRIGEVEEASEYRVEMICADDVLDAAVTALIRAHPYEEPAWEAYAVITSLA
jgi:hypothetical protein